MPVFSVLSKSENACAVHVFRASVLRTKSVTKKQMNKCLAKKCRVRSEFEPRTPGGKVNTITTELKRILLNAVVRYSI